MRLLLVSNMPAPHQLELFRAVAGLPGVNLRALFCAWSAPGRAWSRPTLPAGFEVLPHVSLEEILPGLVFTRGMARRILGSRPDVAIVGGHAMPGLHRAMAVLSRHGVPWLFWEEFHPLPERPAQWRTAVRKRLLFSALERCTAVLGIGQRAVAYFTALTGEAKAVHNFPYGSDLARFTREAPATQPQGPRFLYAGRLVEAKGVELLVRAFARIAERHPSAELVLVGDGPLRSRLEASIPPPIRGRVDFRGHRQWDELPREYARGNVFVFPSRHDGWGMVIPEAMAAGLPIIATRQTGAAIDCLAEGETGFLFDRDDADALVRHMEYFCEQPQAARRMGERAREACRMLDAPQAARRLQEIVSAYTPGSEGEEGRPQECLRKA